MSISDKNFVFNDVYFSIKPQIDNENQRKTLLNLENYFHKFFTPLETYITRIQCLLVGHDLKYTLTFYLLIHLGFWYASHMRFLQIIGWIGFIFVVSNALVNKFWPETKVTEPSDDDKEEWIEIYPELLTLQEISSISARISYSFIVYILMYINLRRTNRLKFFLISSTLLVFTSAVGYFISGFTLVYISVIGPLLSPALVFYNIPQKVAVFINPYISQAERFFNIKRHRKKKNKTKNAVEETDSEDEAIRELCPSQSNTANLLYVEQESGEESSTGHTPRSPSPVQSLTVDSSQESDNEFTFGLKQPPPFDQESLFSLTVGDGSQLSLPPENSQSDSRSRKKQSRPKSSHSANTNNNSDSDLDLGPVSNLSDHQEFEAEVDQAADRLMKLPETITDLIAQKAASAMATVDTGTLLSGVQQLQRGLASLTNQSNTSTDNSIQSSDVDAAMGEFEFLDETELQMYDNETQPESTKK